jgi:hypothetical protein
MSFLLSLPILRSDQFPIGVPLSVELYRNFDHSRTSLCQRFLQNPVAFGGKIGKGRTTRPLLSEYPAS